MAYQVYFADLSEENKALSMTLLRLKEEAGTIEADESKLLEKLRGSPTPWPQTVADEPTPRFYGRGGGGGGSRRGPRRGPSNGRSFRNSSDN